MQLIAHPIQYRPKHSLNVMCKVIEAIIQKSDDHLDRNNLLTKKQYGLQSAMSTAGYHRIKETLNKCIARITAFDISKAFGSV